MTQSKLAKLSPLCQSMISNVANGRTSARLSQDKCREFGTWFLHFRQQQPCQVFPAGEGDKTPRDMRITFHPEHEAPLLRTWFTACPQPSEEDLQHFAAELNRGHVRQERPQVTPDKLRFWWKNEKQKRRRDLRRRNDPFPTSASSSHHRHVTSPERPLRDRDHDPILTSGSLTSGSQSPLGFPGLLQESDRADEM